MKTNYKGDVNSTANQRIKGHLVGREVRGCQTSLPSAVLALEPGTIADLPSWEDAENEARYEVDLPYAIRTEYDYNDEFNGSTHFEGTTSDYQRLTEYLRLEIEESDDAQQQANLDTIEAAEPESQEVYEWWLVSEWFFEKLKEQGEVVLTDGQSHWWGRGGSGQAILLDGVISDIAAGMNILEGQPNEWKL